MSTLNLNFHMLPLSTNAVDFNTPVSTSTSSHFEFETNKAPIPKRFVSFKTIDTEERESELLRGRLSLPNQLKTQFFSRIKTLNPKKQLRQLVSTKREWATVEGLFQSLFDRFMRYADINDLSNREKYSTSMLNWFQALSLEDYNLTTRFLVESGWIVTNLKYGKKWGDVSVNFYKLIEFVSTSELHSLQEEYLLNKYRLKEARNPSLASLSNSEFVREVHSSEYSTTKLSKGGFEDVGLTRPNFTRLTYSPIRYDTEALEPYHNEIVASVLKGLAKTLGSNFTDTNYTWIANNLVFEYLNSPSNVYDLEGLLTDTRGRAIVKQVKRSIFSPITNKYARHAVICEPHKPDVDEIYASITQIHKGSKALTVRGKINYGKAKYLSRSIPDTLKGYDQMYLKRIYKALEDWFADGTLFNVPLELDLTAGIFLTTGLLFGDRNILKSVNALDGKFQDPYVIKGLSRDHAKYGLTPMGYGGSINKLEEYWDNNEVDYTPEDVKLFKVGITNKRYALHFAWKEYLMESCTPKPRMDINLYQDDFTLYPNKYKTVGTSYNKYPVYLKLDGKLRVKFAVTHSVKRIPDVNRLRVFMPTLFAHGLESQMMDNAADVLRWGIPLQDSFSMKSNEMGKFRKRLVKEMKLVYDNRVSIRERFLTSIGSKPTPKMLKLLKMVEPLREEDKFSSNVLK